MQRRWLAYSLVFGALHLLVGCGGSSSETPEPVRPDSWQLKLRHQRQLSIAKEADPDRIITRSTDLERSGPARSTWGTGRSLGPQNVP